jgi:hypothetical protein
VERRRAQSEGRAGFFRSCDLIAVLQLYEPSIKIPRYGGEGRSRCDGGEGVTTKRIELKGESPERPDRDCQEPYSSTVQYCRTPVPLVLG